MTNLVGRKVRLVGPAWNRISRHREGAIRTVVDRSRHGDGYVLSGGGALSFVGGGIFGIEPLPPRERVLVYSFYTPDVDGGFQWSPVDRDPGGQGFITEEFETDKKYGNYEHGVLVEIHLAGYAPDDAGRQRVTDFIEGELEDAISAGLVGKIIARY